MLLRMISDHTSAFSKIEVRALGSDLMSSLLG
jgi:hypothetical protein